MKSRPFGDMAVGVAWLDFFKREAGPSSILDFYNRFVWESGPAVASRRNHRYILSIKLDSSFQKT